MCNGNFFEDTHKQNKTFYFENFKSNELIYEGENKKFEDFSILLIENIPKWLEEFYKI